MVEPQTTYYGKTKAGVQNRMRHKKTKKECKLERAKMANIVRKATRRLSKGGGATRCPEKKEKCSRKKQDHEETVQKGGKGQRSAKGIPKIRKGK